jgi:hypothetical protein
MLFLATTVVAAGCYWLMLPTIKAKQFVRAVALENYGLADSFFRDPDDQFLFDWNEKHWRFRAIAEMDPWSVREFARCRRSVTLRVTFGDAGPMRSGAWVVVATAFGLQKPEPTWSGGGMGGGGIL